MHPILADRLRLRLYLIAWGLVGALLGLLVRTLIGTPWVDALVFGLPLGLVAAPVSLSAWYLCRAMPLSRTGATQVAVSALGAAIITSAIWAALGRGWWVLLGRNGFELPGEAGSPLVTLLVGFGALSYLLAVTVQYVQQAFEESAAAARRALESQVAQREAELGALRAQVDPHFLFNSLNSISGLIVPDPSKARLMCQRLADFLRDSLSFGSAARVSVAREVALAGQYLGVERVRFGERLQLETAVAPDCADLLVPALILQPLVENAVRHGVATLVEGGTIAIGARRAGALVVLTVANPRDPDGSGRGTGFGLDLVRRRLAAAFGDRAALVVEPAPASFRATVTLPAEEPPHE
jgi:two-component system, LytTR family, sensor histidine kinase AlgZ